VSLKDIQAARNQRRKNLQNEIKQRVSLVDAILSSKQKTPSIIQSPEIPIKSIKLKLYRSDDE
jgi:putative transposase